MGSFMKRSLRIIGAALALLVLLCALALVLEAPRSMEWYADYVEKNGALLSRIAKGELEPDHSPRAQWVLRRGGVETIHSDDAATFFYLNGGPVEGHLRLVYAPSGSYVPVCLNWSDNWFSVDTEGDGLRWEGGPMGKGYVNLNELGGGFLLEEAYLPT